MKRIGIIIDSLYGGGAERVMLNLAGELVAQGHAPTIFCFGSTCDHDIPDGVVVQFVLQGTSEKLKLYGTKVHKKHAEILKECVAQVEQSTGKFDLFLANLDKTNQVVAKTDLAPVYFVVHNAVKATLSRAFKMGPIKYWRQRQAFKTLSGKDLICVSKGVEREINSMSLFDPRSTQTIYNPFNCDKISAQSLEENTLIPSEPYIIHVGRLGRQKRHDVLFQALSKVPDVKLVCLSSNENKLRKLAKKYGVEQRLILPGFQKNPYPWVKQAQALVISSDYEGFCSVLVEAVICGTVPVSTNCPHGADEILIGDLGQFLSPVGNSDALAVNITAALSFKGDLSQAEVLQHVSSSRIAQQYLSLI